MHARTGLVRRETTEASIMRRDAWAADCCAELPAGHHLLLGTRRRIQQVGPAAQGIDDVPPKDDAPYDKRT